MESRKLMFGKYNLHFLEKLHAACPFLCIQEKRECNIWPQRWRTARGFWPCGNQFGPFEVHPTHIWEIYFHFLNNLHAACPFLWEKGKGSATVDLKSEWQHGLYDFGAINLDYLEYTRHIFGKYFSIFLTSYMQYVHFSASKRKGSATFDRISEGQRGVCDPGAINFDLLEYTKPIFGKYISTFSITYMEHIHFSACKGNGSATVDLNSRTDPYSINMFPFISKLHTAYAFLCMQEKQTCWTPNAPVKVLNSELMCSCVHVGEVYIASPDKFAQLWSLIAFPQVPSGGTSLEMWDL